MSVCIVRGRKASRQPKPEALSEIITHQLISYRELQLATDNFSEANLLGVGSSGSVYKGMLNDGTIVAIKVLNLQDEAACKRFDTECEVLRSIRHRNLVKVITSCSNQNVRVIVLQHMPNGNLDKWLYGYGCQLDLLQRIDIMLDVAMAMKYLHHDCDDPVVHCDLKPSNVLLDEDMVAHVSDFGISKILAEDNVIAQTRTLGTVGYIAPEYGSEGLVSPRGDVYSYGIMLMETFTKRKPTEEIFTETNSLRQWVKASYSTAPMDLVDTGLYNGEAESKMQRLCCSSVLELALDCSKKVPEERISMEEVEARLRKIKDKMLETRP